MSQKLKKLLHGVKEQQALFLMLIPGLIALISFSYFPMFGIITAFEKFEINKGFFGSKFVGFENFYLFLTDPMIYTVIKNTLGISALKLIICFPVPILFALLLNEVNKTMLKRTVQTISYLPHFISWVVVFGIWGKMLSAENGVVNGVLEALGMKTINFLVISQYMWPLAVITEVWKETGWGAILYLAAFTAINPEIYEAAIVDGAGRLRQLWHVTLPGIKSTIIIMLILTVPTLVGSSGISGSTFEQMWVLGSLPVRDVTEVIDTYVLRIGLGNAQYSLAAAVGLAKTFISIILIVSVNKIAKKMGETGVY